MHNLNNNIKQWNDCFIMGMNFKHFQKTICDFQSIKYHSTKNMKVIILNEYMQNIYLGFDEI
jgi:hypothetical protein